MICLFALEKRSLILIFALLSILHIAIGASGEEERCPVCMRVMRAVRDYAKERNMTPSIALRKYCGIEELEVSVVQFCYNIGTVMQDLGRVLDLGADEVRICKKVENINPHFCTSTKQKDGGVGKNIDTRGDNTDGIVQDGESDNEGEKTKKNTGKETYVILNERLKRGIIYI